jgi:hypothetical protein
MSGIDYIKRQAQADVEAVGARLKVDPAALVPTYGNYGGPGWTGGQRGGNNTEPKSPSDKLDEKFKEHDDAYGKAGDVYDYMKADRQLIESIEQWQRTNAADTDEKLKTDLDRQYAKLMRSWPSRPSWRNN